ncbi:M56 family metallopeptidase [Pontibacter akesuensis]|uniref:Signal transducer regulating beta-lactamase production, contains metallopeptidase domain n=1 Tax=Pontibacter akesuensis TaxID=388950 RepID=A0A1I7I7N6_9BACT|nr:M56 family metallopeptidase [Pontibacter akesuensis]GHA65663.1 hypothetical protein GCM10007389_18220 [Pontibacter akesuensis]SFU68987.1 Signal transducer regulating beta-lactamase production, contains metallopeptidase domain [Pontibacter akesuensis]
MNQLANLIPEGLINALGWTLLHSLWQGAFVALLLSLLLVLLHRHTARTRYAVSGAAMTAQLLLSLGTFGFYYAQHQAPAQMFYTSEAVSTLAVATPAPSFWADPLAVAQVYFEQHLPLLVTLWLLGLVLMTVRLIGGVAYTQRLRHYKTRVAAVQWQQRLKMLSERLGVKKGVQLLESALVQVPMAIGVAKPVILFPIGALTGLSQAQVEAILAHELAHIARKDYLFNLLQSVVDLLFFYHPAMWWLSGVVRAERENCCDDLAVALCGDTLTYARALTEIESLHLTGAPAMALAFSGKRGKLMHRIKRLLGRQPLTPSFSEGFAAGLVLVAGMLVLTFGASAALRPQNDTTHAQTAKNNLDKTTPAPDVPEANAYVAQDSAGENRNVILITNKKGKVKELYVNGKRIPDRDLNKYKSLIDQRLQAMENATKAGRAEAQELVAQASSELADARTESSVAPAPPVAPLPPAYRIAVAPPLPPMPPAPPQSNATRKEIKQYEQEVKAFEEEMAQFKEELHAVEKLERGYRTQGIWNDSTYRDQKKLQREMMQQSKLQRAEMEAKREEMGTRRPDLDRRRAEIEQRRAEMEVRRAETDVRRAEMEQRRKEQEKIRKKMREELVKDGLIESDSSDLNMQFNNDALYINGKKQPQHVYDKYKKILEGKQP